MDNKLTNEQKEIVDYLVDIGYDREDIINEKYILIGNNQDYIIKYLFENYDKSLSLVLENGRFHTVFDIDSYVNELIEEGVLEKTSDDMYLFNTNYSNELMDVKNMEAYDEYVEYLPGDKLPEDINQAVTNYFGIDWEEEGFGAFLYVFPGIKSEKETGKILLAFHNVPKHLIKHLDFEKNDRLRTTGGVRLTEVGALLMY